jgi:hypothetical protein
MPLHASHPDIVADPVLVRVYRLAGFFEGKVLLGEAAIGDSSWKTLSLSLPDEMGREIILLLEVSRTRNPQKTLGTPDPRDLGVAVGKIG